MARFNDEPGRLFFGFELGECPAEENSDALDMRAKFD
jgi:hypothetical protein